MLDSYATLRVASDTLSLKDINDLLGEPSDGFSKGDEYGNAKRLRNHTQWNLTLGKDKNSSLQSDILEILEFLSHKETDDLFEECSVDIFCMLSSDNGQGSFTLDQNVCDKLSKLKLPITFDFYSD